LFLDFGRTSFGDERGEDRLERERNEIAVVKESRKEISSFGHLLKNKPSESLRVLEEGLGLHNSAELPDMQKVKSLKRDVQY